MARLNWGPFPAPPPPAPGAKAALGVTRQPCAALQFAECAFGYVPRKAGHCPPMPALRRPPSTRLRLIGSALSPASLLPLLSRALCPAVLRPRSLGMGRRLPAPLLGRLRPDPGLRRRLPASLAWLGRPLPEPPDACPCDTRGGSFRSPPPVYARCLACLARLAARRAASPTTAARHHSTSGVAPAGPTSLPLCAG